MPASAASAARALEPLQSPIALAEIGGPDPLDDLLYLPLVPPLARRRARRRRPCASPPARRCSFQVELGRKLRRGAGGSRRRRRSARRAPRRRSRRPRPPALRRRRRLPLVAGLTDDPALWAAGCGRLRPRRRRGAGAGARSRPGGRPPLVAGCGEGRRSSRSSPPAAAAEAERLFARTAARHGLAPFLPRPLPPPMALGAGSGGLPPPPPPSTAASPATSRWR